MELQVIIVESENAGYIRRILVVGGEKIRNYFLNKHFFVSKGVRKKQIYFCRLSFNFFLPVFLTIPFEQCLLTFTKLGKLFFFWIFACLCVNKNWTQFWRFLDPYQLCVLRSTTIQTLFSTCLQCMYILFVVLAAKRRKKMTKKRTKKQEGSQKIKGKMGENEG